MIQMKETAHCITQADVDLFCSDFHITLPRSYQDFLLSHNGGVPSLTRCQIRGLKLNEYGSIDRFFSLNTPGPGYDLRRILTDLGLPGEHEIIPIASNGSGDFVCLNGAFEVVFWDRMDVWHNQGLELSDLYHCTESFELFIRSLR